MGIAHTNIGTYQCVHLVLQVELNLLMNNFDNAGCREAAYEKHTMKRCLFSVMQSSFQSYPIPQKTTQRFVIEQQLVAHPALRQCPYSVTKDHICPSGHI
jgi:hypothetical protein